MLCPPHCPGTHSRGQGPASGSQAGLPCCSGVRTPTAWHSCSWAVQVGCRPPCPPGSYAPAASWARHTQETPGQAAGHRSGPGMGSSVTPRPHTQDSFSGDLAHPRVSPLWTLMPHIRPWHAAWGCWGWPRRCRSHWGHQASGVQRTCGVLGVCLGVGARVRTARLGL